MCEDINFNELTVRRNMNRLMLPISLDIFFSEEHFSLKYTKSPQNSLTLNYSLSVHVSLTVQKKITVAYISRAVFRIFLSLLFCRPILTFN